MAKLVECKLCKHKVDPSEKTCPNCGIALIKTWMEQIIDTMTPIKLAKWFLVMIGVVIVYMVVVFGRYYFNFNGELSTDRTVWGTFGDYIGGTLNPILSFLSLIALLCTIVLQSKELELTRKELKLTRKELSRSASAQKATKKILDKQSKTLARQQFESTFFSLLDQHNKVLDYLSENLPDRTSINSKIHHRIFLRAEVTDLASAKATLEEHNSICGHYFRILYQLLKFIATNVPGGTIGSAFEADKIESSDVTVNEKMYSNIVRSVLSYPVTQLLSVNCYCDGPENTYWRYKLLIERYAFLEHMPFEVKGTERTILLETSVFYKDLAFGNSSFLKKLNHTNAAPSP